MECKVIFKLESKMMIVAEAMSLLNGLLVNTATKETKLPQFSHK